MKTIVKAIDMMNEKIARLFSYLSILLILQLCYEVFCRYVINKPNIWSFDATYFISSMLIIFGFSYTWKKGGHVGVDLFMGKLNKRIAAAIFIIFMISLFFTTWGNILREMINNLIFSWGIKEKSMSGSMPPIYPYKTWMALGVVSFLIQGVSEFLKSLNILITGKELGEQKEGVSW